MEMKSIAQKIESVSEKLDKLIEENGGSARDALNVTLAKLEWAEWEIAQLKSAQQPLAPDVLPCGHPKSSLVRLGFGQLPYCEDCKRQNAGKA